MNSGIFSTSLKALQLQVQNMMEGAGGEQAAHLLDELADLGVKEREVMLELFSELIKKFKAGDKRFLTDQDLHQQDLIDSLYEEVLSQLYGSDEAEMTTPSGSNVVHLTRQENPPIDLSAYRASKREKEKSALLWTRGS